MIYKRFWLLISLQMLSGCGTVLSLIENDYSIYSGVTRDLNTIQEGGMFSILAAIDLPLSFILDTLILPISLSQ